MGEDDTVTRVVTIVTGMMMTGTEVAAGEGMVGGTDLMRTITTGTIMKGERCL